MMKSPRNVRIGPRRTYKNETTSLIFKKSTSKKRNYPKKNHIAISIILYLSLLPLPWSYNGLCVNARIVLNQKSYQTKIQTIKFKGSCRRINFQKQVLNKKKHAKKSLNGHTDYLVLIIELLRFLKGA